MLNDAEKSIKIRTEETITGSGKMKTFGELNKSSLSVVVAKNAGLKWVEGRRRNEEMMRKHNVTSIICAFITQKPPSKNEMPQNKKHMKVNYSVP